MSQKKTKKVSRILQAKLSTKIEIMNQSLSQGITCKFTMKNEGEPVKILKVFNPDAVDGHWANNLLVEVRDDTTGKLLRSKFPLLYFLEVPTFKTNYKVIGKFEEISKIIHLTNVVTFTKGRSYSVRAIYDSEDMSEWFGFEFQDDVWYGKVPSNTVSISVVR